MSEQAGGDTLSLPDGSKGEFINKTVPSLVEGEPVTLQFQNFALWFLSGVSFLSLDVGPCLGLGVVVDGWDQGLGFEGRSDGHQNNPVWLIRIRTGDMQESKQLKRIIQNKALQRAAGTQGRHQ